MDSESESMRGPGSASSLGSWHTAEEEADAEELALPSPIRVISSSEDSPLHAAASTTWVGQPGFALPESGPFRAREASSLFEPDGSTYDWRTSLVPSPASGTIKTMKIRVYRVRWHMLAIFALGSCNNAFMWISFAPIVPATADIFGTTATGVNSLSMCFMGLYLPASLLAAWMLGRYGLRASIISGATLSMLGAWLRWLRCACMRYHSSS